MIAEERGWPLPIARSEAAAEMVRKTLSGRWLTRDPFEVARVHERIKGCITDADHVCGAFPSDRSLTKESEGFFLMRRDHSSFQLLPQNLSRLTLRLR